MPSFVQFIHPGGEHGQDAVARKGWNAPNHRRKFITLVSAAHHIEERLLGLGGPGVPTTVRVQEDTMKGKAGILKGRTAILTGASYGFGPYIARALAREGVSVALAARSADWLAGVAEELSSMAAKAVVVPVDLRDARAREALVARAEAELGPIDILVNNAGVHYGGRLHVRTPAHIDAVIETNLTAPIALTHRVLPTMLRRGTGHIVQIASLAGKVALPYFSLYSATKHGLVGFTHALQAELHGTGVHASVVCPGFVEGEGMWARLGRPVHVAFGLSKPEAVAAAVVAALKHEPVETIVNPLPVRPVIAAWALAPGFASSLFRAIRIDRFMREASLQVEADVR
jgi:short-subunit dehydrogenase